MGERQSQRRIEVLSPRGVFLALMTSTAILVGALFYSQHISRQINERYAWEIRGTRQICRHVDQAWIRVWPAGQDEQASVMDAAIDQLDAAAKIASAMIHGGSSAMGEHLPVTDPVLKKTLEAISRDIAECRGQLVDYLQIEEPAGYERVVRKCQDLVHLSETFRRNMQSRAAQRMIDGNSRIQELDWFLLVGLTALVVFAGGASRRYTLRHRTAEEALQVSEEKYRGLFESSIDAVMLLDENQFFDCNPAALRTFGLESKEAFRSKHPAELSPPIQPNGIDSVSSANERIAQAYREGGCRFEWVHRRKDGTNFPCEVVLSSLVVEGRPILQALARDMTERKEVERQLREKEEKLRTITESALDAVIMMDGDGKAAHWNPAAERIFGYSAEEMLGHEIHKFLAPLGRQNDVTRGLPGFFTSGQGPMARQVVELQAVRKGGLEFPIEISLSPIRIDGSWWAVAVARDISDRKQAEQALRQSHAELRAIYDGLADGLLIADIATRRFESANRAISEMLGYSQAELLRMSVDQIHPPEVIPKVIEEFDRIAKEEQGLASSIPVLRKDGTIFYADVSNAKVVYRNRPCLIGFFRDISDRKRAAEALLSEQRSLRRVLKSHDQERQLIAYEIHDGLAQQLIAAIMQCQSIENATANASADVAETFRNVLRMLKQALNETRRLISGVRPPILDELGVVSAIRGLVHEMSRTDGPQVDLRAGEELDRMDAVIENSVYRIVQESLTNACRHSGSRNVRIELSRQNNVIRIVVRDWGVGFNPNEVDEKRYGVAGIRERVRLLGGRLRIDSKPGEGTRILVQLPCEITDSVNSTNSNHESAD